MKTLINPYDLLWLVLWIARLTNGFDIGQTIQISVEPSGEYQAPLHGGQENVVPDQYVVYLAKGYSMEQHKHTVGQALQESDVLVVFDNLFPDKICYSVNMDAESLSVIRGDRGVELVEYNTYSTATID